LICGSIYLAKRGGLCGSVTRRAHSVFP
jgi:hypothetical protein